MTKDFRLSGTVKICDKLADSNGRAGTLGEVFYNEGWFSL